MGVMSVGAIGQWVVAGRVGLVAALAFWVGACGTESGVSGPDGPTLMPPGLLVSNVADGGAPVFVSLPPGSVPGGTSATVVNLQTSTLVAVAMMDGGFDPIPVDAIAGDSLQVEVRLGGGAPPVTTVMRVPANIPPIVVRTEPAAGKRDVPLNARIIVVFSEPIAPGTLKAGAIRVRRGPTEITGDIAFIDEWHVMAEFVPHATLEPDSDYELVISSEIQDLDGDPLLAAVSVGFSTASATSIQLVFTEQPSSTIVGSAVTPAVRVSAYDALGQIVTSFADTITISFVQNPGAMPLTGTLKVAAVQGVATFSDLRVQAEGTGYRLGASAAGAIPGTSTYFVATVTTPPADLRLSPAALEVSQGSGAITQVIVTTPGSVSLGIAGTPVGTTATFGTSSLYRFLLVRVDPTAPPGDYNVSVRSTSLSGTDSVVLPLTVVANPAGFRLQVASSSVSSWISDARNIGVTLSRTSDSGPVALNVSDSRGGIAWSVEPGSITDSTSMLRLSMGGSSGGTHILRVTGVGATGSSSAEIFVFVNRVIP